MRSLATLGGVLVLIVLAIAWKISNQVEAGQDPTDDSGRVTLGMIPEDADPDLRPSQAVSAKSENKGGQDTPPLPAAPEGAAPSAAEEIGETPPFTPGDPSSNKPEAQPQPTAEDEPQPAPVEVTPEPPVEEELAGLRYTVQSGDTLYGILMRAYGKADEALIDSIAVASDLDDPSQLSVGLTLILPKVPGYQDPKQP